MLLKCCTQYASTFGKLSSGHRSVFIPIPKKGNPKECSDYSTIALISHASKEMLKILQARLQQYMNWKLLDVQAGFRKGRGTRNQIANIFWIMEKAREFWKASIHASSTTLKPLTVWIIANCGTIFKEIGIPDHPTCLLRNLYIVQTTNRTGHGTMDWFQNGKGVHQGHIVTLFI